MKAVLRSLVDSGLWFLRLIIICTIDILLVVFTAFSVLPSIAAYLATLANITAETSTVAWLATWFVPYLFIAAVLTVLIIFACRAIYRKSSSILDKIYGKMEDRRKSKDDADCEK